MPAYATPERVRMWDRSHHRILPPIQPEPQMQRVFPVLQRTEQIQPVSVLFVDGSNEVRSVLAHAQAEIIRMRVLCHRGYNLFDCVDSAGFRIDTPLARKGNWPLHSGRRPANNVAVEALTGHPTHEEGQDVQRRFLNKHITRGVHYSDFDEFDYIVTFENESLQRLRTLEREAYRQALRLGKPTPRAKLRLLGGYSSRHITVPIFSPVPSRIPSHSDFRIAIDLINAEIHHFLHSVTGWTPAERASQMQASHRYRSRQFLVQKSKVTDTKIRLLKGLHKRVHVDDEIEGRDTRVVTMTARHKDELREALDDCRNAFS